MGYFDVSSDMDTCIRVLSPHIFSLDNMDEEEELMDFFEESL
jgi:hypothetical protein